MTDHSRTRDHMADLGVLALVSRLRRLSDRLWEETASLYSELGFEFQPKWFSVFSAIEPGRHPSISELGSVVGITTQGVGKIVDELLAAGLLLDAVDPTDSRVRRISLSTKGQAMREDLDPVWQGMQTVTEILMAEAGVDLVADLDQIEEALINQSHGERLRHYFNLPSSLTPEIVDYRPAYKKHFQALNEEWLSCDFSVEGDDARVLADPNGRILRRGGHILFALVRGEVVGTCALIRQRGGGFELAKMAVAPEFRQQGIGTALTISAVDRALDSGTESVWLRTHFRPKSAHRMYSKIGFRRVAKDLFPPSPVTRESVTMRLNIAAYIEFKAAQE